MHTPASPDSPPPAGAARGGRLGGAAAEGGVLLVLCALLYWVSTGFDSVPAVLSQNVPPELFPRMLLLTIAGLSVVMMWQGRGTAVAPMPRIRRILLVAAAAWIGCALFAMTGVVTLVACCGALCALWGERRPASLALYALLYPAAVYVVFVLFLGLRFPDGVWR